MPKKQPMKLSGLSHEEQLVLMYMLGYNQCEVDIQSKIKTASRPFEELPEMALSWVEVVSDHTKGPAWWNAKFQNMK